MRNAVIVSAARTAVGKAPKGTLRTTRPDEMAAAVIKAVIERAGIDKNEIEDVVLGCAFPEAEQGMNMARIVALRAGLPVTTAGQTVNRFCSSGLQTHRHRRPADHGRHGRRDHRRRRREHVHGADDRQQVRAQPVPGQRVPGRLPGHGADRRERGAPVRDQPRGAGRLCPAQPPARRRRPGRRQVRRRDRAAGGRRQAGRGQRSQGNAHRLQAGRRRAPRHQPGGAGQAQAGLCHEGHRHRRQQLADQRRRRGRADHERGEGQGAGAQAAGALRQLCRGRRPAGSDGHRPDCGRAQGAQVRRHGARATST